jgi:hypothetical protein
LIYLAIDLFAAHGATGAARQRPDLVVRSSNQLRRPTRAVSHLDHMYAGCGYDNALNHVSATSFGGECRNVSGLPCENNGRYWMCPDAAADYYAQADIFPASTFVHAFAHPFSAT